MKIDYYIVFYCIVVIAFFVIMFMLAFSNYNKNVLKKSYLDTKLYIYIVLISAIYYIATIIISTSITASANITYLSYALIFLAYSVSVMLTLFVLLRPLKAIEDKTRELAKGRKNLNIDFEGALEFDSIAENLKNVQKKYRENDKKLNKKDAMYQKYIAKEYLKYFGGKKIEEIEVGENVQVKLCTLFCDMRNSYFSSETLSLQDNFNLINEFLSLVSSKVKDNNGFVDRFVGDGVVAIFDNEDDALKSANEIAKQLDYKNLVSIGKEPIKYGISLNSGMCVVGVVGSKNQKQFTAISDTINLCSRIEDLNKIFGTRVLMTKNFMSNLNNAYISRYVGTIEFDDLTSKIPVFESLEAYSDAKKSSLLKTLDEFESGVRYFEKGEFEKSKQCFAKCLKNDNADLLSKFYFARAKDSVNNFLPILQNH